jgi:hypothetical protein
VPPNLAFFAKEHAEFARQTSPERILLVRLKPGKGGFGRFPGDPGTIALESRPRGIARTIFAFYLGHGCP